MRIYTHTCTYTHTHTHTHTHTTYTFSQYKYQLNVDGTVAAYRLPYLLAGGSLVFKQDSNYYEHFYHRLEPWVHYVPLRRDLSDVVEQVEWATRNDGRAAEMADNALRFAQSYLLPEHLYCYIVRLLKVRPCTLIVASFPGLRLHGCEIKSRRRLVNKATLLVGCTQTAAIMMTTLTPAQW